MSDSTGSYALARTVIQLFETENNQLLVTMPQQGIDPPWLVRPLEELASWLTSVSLRCVSKAPGIALEDGHSVRGIYVTLAVNAKPLHVLITLSRTPTVQLTVRGRGAGAAGEPTAGHDCGQYKC